MPYCVPPVKGYSPRTISSSGPDHVVHRLIERGTVAVLSGDTGAAKSIVSMSLLPAALNGEEWLGVGSSSLVSLG
jgi:RecA-family ATPase